MIKAIFFDLDGVLIDAKDWHYQALNKALSLYGYTISLDDHISVYDGLPTSKKLEILHNLKGLSPELFAPIKQFKKQYTDEIAKNERIYNFQIYKCIEKLSRHYNLACCSNSIIEFVEICLKRMGIIDFFDTWYGNDTVSYPKPDPEMYNKARDYFELLPEECLIIEDNENGIKAARASGCNLMVVSSPKEIYFDNIKKEIDKYK